MTILDLPLDLLWFLTFDHLAFPQATKVLLCCTETKRLLASKGYWRKKFLVDFATPTVEPLPGQYIPVFHRLTKHMRTADVNWRGVYESLVGGFLASEEEPQARAVDLADAGRGYGAVRIAAVLNGYAILDAEHLVLPKTHEFVLVNLDTGEQSVHKGIPGLVLPCVHVAIQRNLQSYDLSKKETRKATPGVAILTAEGHCEAWTLEDFRQGRPLRTPPYWIYEGSRLPTAMASVPNKPTMIVVGYQNGNILLINPTHHFRDYAFISWKVLQSYPISSLATLQWGEGVGYVAAQGCGKVTVGTPEVDGMLHQVVYMWDHQITQPQHLAVASSLAKDEITVVIGGGNRMAGYRKKRQQILPIDLKTLPGLVMHVSVEFCICADKDMKSVSFYDVNTMELVKYVYLGKKIVDLRCFDARLVLAVVEEGGSFQLIVITPDYEQLLQKHSTSN